MLIQAWNLPIPNLATRIARAWTDGTRPAIAPWVVLVQSERAMEALDIYFGHARGEQIEHDDYMRALESYLLLADHWVTVVRRAPLDQQEVIVLTTDPAAERGILTVCSDQLIEQGFGCVAREADTSWMYHHYSEPGWVELG